jgi:hypothetical protein
MRSRGVSDVKFEIVESVPPKLLVTRVVGEKSFGGTWTCEIARVPEGSFVSRFVIGHHRTIDGAMGVLRKRFGAG